jgi:hypothetical protein
MLLKGIGQQAPAVEIKERTPREAGDDDGVARNVVVHEPLVPARDVRIEVPGERLVEDLRGPLERGVDHAGRKVGADPRLVVAQLLGRPLLGKEGEQLDDIRVLGGSRTLSGLKERNGRLARTSDPYCPAVPSKQRTSVFGILCK